MAFLRTSTQQPPRSPSAAPPWHEIKKHITIPGHMFCEKPVDQLMLLFKPFEVMTFRLASAIDYSINLDFWQISAIDMQVCVLGCLHGVSRIEKVPTRPCPTSRSTNSLKFRVA